MPDKCAVYGDFDFLWRDLDAILSPEVELRPVSSRLVEDNKLSQTVTVTIGLQGPVTPKGVQTAVIHQTFSYEFLYELDAHIAASRTAAASTLPQ